MRAGDPLDVLVLRAQGAMATAAPGCDHQPAHDLDPTAARLPSVVVLVLVLAGALTIGLAPGGRLPSRRIAAPFTAAGRTAAMTAAGGLLAAYGMTRDTPLLMAGAFPNESPVQYVVAGLADAAVRQGTIVSVRELRDNQQRIHASLALAAVEQLLARPRPDISQQYAIPDGAVLGSGPLEAVAADPPQTDDGTRLFELRNVQDAEHQERAQRALEMEAKAQLRNGDVDMARYLTETAASVCVAPTDTLPPAVRQASQETEDWMVYEPFVLHDPPTTDPIAPPEPQAVTPNPDFKPKSALCLHRASFWCDLEEWFERALAWMRAIAVGKDPPPRPEVFVRSNTEAFVADAQGVVWDMRRASEGIVEPLDFQAKQDSKWNLKWLRAQWRDYPDQEAVSHACDGADILKGQLPFHYCLSPHLLSIADDYATVVADLRKLAAEGVYAWFTSFAFCPTRFNGQGTRPKGDGKRRIASGSCPYDPIVDADGCVARSINEEMRQPLPPEPATPPFARWRRALLQVLTCLLLTDAIHSWPRLRGAPVARFRKERKHGAAHAMVDTTVLRAIGDRVGETLYYFLDDFAHFFYQIVLAVRCLWYSGIYIFDQTTGCGAFVVELVLAMGYTSCSNIAQMVCEAILYIFEDMMDRAEGASGDTNPLPRRHPQAQGEHARQAPWPRVYHTRVYGRLPLRHPRRCSACARHRHLAHAPPHCAHPCGARAQATGRDARDLPRGAAPRDGPSGGGSATQTAACRARPA